MNKWNINQKDALKNWDTEDLVEAYESAKLYSFAPIVGTRKMWRDRARAYHAELITRNAIRSTK
jgi:hypothetical protein